MLTVLDNVKAPEIRGQINGIQPSKVIVQTDWDVYVPSAVVSTVQVGCMCHLPIRDYVFRSLLELKIQLLPGDYDNHIKTYLEKLISAVKLRNKGLKDHPTTVKVAKTTIAHK